MLKKILKSFAGKTIIPTIFAISVASCGQDQAKRYLDADGMDCQPEVSAYEKKDTFCITGLKCEAEGLEETKAYGLNNKGECTKTCLDGCWTGWECYDPDDCLNGAIGEETCGSDVGECVPGVRTRECVNGQWDDWGDCTGYVGPSEEVCNNKDDDCDGLIDGNLEQKVICGFNNQGEKIQYCYEGVWKDVFPCEEPYGCEGPNTIQQQVDGSYKFLAAGTFYKHPTGISVSVNDTLEGTASGTVSWWSIFSDYTAGPDSTAKTWGLWAQVGDNTPLYLGSSFNKKLIESGEFYFMIPENKIHTQCYLSDYSNNSGGFEILFKIIK